MRKKDGTLFGTKLKRAAVAAFAAALCLTLSVTAFVPFPHRLSADNFLYRCEWADGSVGEERFISVYKDLVGTDGQFILTERNGLRGRCDFHAQEEYRTLKEGNFGEVSALHFSDDATRLDRAALLRTFSDTLWYAGEYFTWSGSAIRRASRTTCAALVALDGDASAAVAESSAIYFDLRKEASVTADAFRHSSVRYLSAQPPYAAREGLLYLDTPGGRRLLASLNCVTDATIEADYCDEGALLSAVALERVTAPFAGNMREASSSYFRGQFAHLFSDKGIYKVPPSLKSVCVTGGVLGDYAFYACVAVEEVDACGVKRENIGRYAFSNLVSLKRLHTPRRDVALPEGAFSARTAECGCTVYEREQKAA